MKKFAVLAGVVVAGIVLARSGSGPLSAFVKSMNEASSISASMSFQRIGGTAQNFNVDLAKPNLVRLDKPNQLIVADGTSIVTFDKKAKTYFKTPQNEAELRKLLSEDEFSVFLPFFAPNAFDNLQKVTAAGTKNRKGIAMNVVEAQADPKGNKKIVFYIDPSNNLARQVELTYSDGPQVIRALVDVKDIKIGGMENSLFAFNAPAGSRELSLEEMNSDKWYYDLEEAKKVAKSTNRKIFVDFYAEWCGPCKLLAAEVFPLPEFKKLSKDLVFCKIDVDAQPTVSKAYNITAMPTQLVLNADGSVVGTKVGYGGVQDFFNFINGYVSR